MEQSPHEDVLGEAFVEAFKTLFRGREHVYGQYGDGPDRKIRTIKEAPPDLAWRRHLAGEGPYLGIVPIREDNTCYFGAIDIDDTDVDIVALAKRIAELDLPLVACRSKSGGVHLYVFFAAAVPADLLYKKLSEWSASLGFTHNKVDGRPIELFPKQTRLAADAVGNWINLPYYGADVSSRRAYVESGDPLSLSQFLTLATRRRVADRATLLAISAEHSLEFDDGPPCLSHLHQVGFLEGSRNNGLFNVAIYMKLAFPADWEERTRDYNKNKFQPPLPADEADSVIKSVATKDYTYTCNSLPIAPHCKKRPCGQKRYGIKSAKAQTQLHSFPDVSRLRKILTDPPMWIVSLDGKDVNINTDDLLSQTRLKKAVLEQHNVVLPVLRQNDYDTMLRDLLADVEEIDAPRDAGDEGQFIQLVGQFLERRQSAESRQDLLSGLPYEEKGRVFFRSADLMTYLERKRFRVYTSGDAFIKLRPYDVEHIVLRIGSGTQTVRVWSLPAGLFDEQQSDFAPRPLPDKGPEF